MDSPKNSFIEHKSEWIDTTFGKRQWVVPLNFWVGCFCIALGMYIFGLVIFGKLSGLISILITCFSIIFFVTAGSILVQSMRNAIDRAHIIKYNDGLFQVEFWWHGKRKNISFSVNDVQQVSSCATPKGIIQWFASLPREPICYRIILRDGVEFVVAGKEEVIHEIVKRFSAGKVRVKGDVII